jgi:hypothetical protein
MKVAFGVKIATIARTSGEKIKRERVLQRVPFKQIRWVTNQHQQRRSCEGESLNNWFQARAPKLCFFLVTMITSQTCQRTLNLKMSTLHQHWHQYIGYIIAENDYLYSQVSVELHLTR